MSYAEEAIKKNKEYLENYTHCMPEDFVEGFVFEVKTSFTQTKEFVFTPGMLLDDTKKQSSPTIIDHYRFYPGLFMKKK